MKQLIMRIVFSLCCMGSAHLYAAALQPAHCPSSSTIKATGLAYVEDMGNHFYAVYQISDYGTSNEWGFGIVGVQASSQREAIRKGSQILETLGNASDPTPMPDQNTWVCIYHNQSQVLSMAVTPVPMDRAFHKIQIG